MNELAEDHPDEHALLMVALNFEKQQAKWLERAKRAAQGVPSSVKTYIRKTDSAFDMLAATMAARAVQTLNSPPLAEKVKLARLKEIIDRREDCRIVRAEVAIRIDGRHVEVEERMTVQATTDGAEHYVVGKTLPYKSTVVESETLSGAEILDVEQPHEHWLLELLAFNHPLSSGEEHRFVVVHDTFNMAPMWTATSFHEVDELVIRVRFRKRPYGVLYAVEGFPPKLLSGQDIGPILEEHAHRVGLEQGEAELIFTNLKYNQSYGVGWALAD
jgi:hypothetical protein